MIKLTQIANNNEGEMCLLAENLLLDEMKLEILEKIANLPIERLEQIISIESKFNKRMCSA